MADVLVVFGSSSDSAVYSRVMKGLGERGISAELRICSAHRTPKQLDSIVGKSDAKLVIGGAGLSAALPGAIASRTTKPVIGVPVSGNYSGLDALLSIAQMPPGVPVIAVGVDAAEQAVSAAELAFRGRGFVKLLGNTLNKKIKDRIDRAVEKTRGLGLAFEFIGQLREGRVDPTADKFDPTKDILINAVEFAQFTPLKLPGALALNVPILEESGATEATEFLEKSKQGLWLGLNRVDNALIAAAQIINIGNRGFEKKLLQFRKGLEHKTVKADAEERKKFA